MHFPRKNLIGEIEDIVQTVVGFERSFVFRPERFAEQL